MSEQYSFFTRTQEPYSILLNRLEWFKRRNEILERDCYKCAACGKTEHDNVVLQVHHKCYVRGFDPWEYDGSYLITLCSECHSSLHLHRNVPIFELIGGSAVQVNFTRCSRCGGMGWIPQYKHVMNGICFKCWGTNYEEFSGGIEEYAIIHGIEIDDIRLGFRPISENVSEFSRFFCIDNSFGLPFKINDAYIARHLDSDITIVIATLSSGQILYCLPDHTMELKLGDQLDVDTLLYRIVEKRDHEPYVVVKGNRI